MPKHFISTIVGICLSSFIFSGCNLTKETNTKPNIIYILADDLDALIDLEESISLNQISVRFLDKLDSWIFPPEMVQISISTDGKEFINLPVEFAKERAEGGVAFIHHFKALTNNSSARFIRVYGKNIAVCPDWHPGDGGKAWMFVDEIIIE